LSEVNGLKGAFSGLQSELRSGFATKAEFATLACGSARKTQLEGLRSKSGTKAELATVKSELVALKSESATKAQLGRLLAAKT
jgi:hypothetical protein